MARIVYVALHRWSDLHRRSHSLTTALSRRSDVEQVVYVNPRVELSALIERPGRELRGANRLSWRTVHPRNDSAGPTVLTPLRRFPFSGRLPSLGRADLAVAVSKIEKTAGGPFHLVSNAIDPESEELVLELAGRHPFHFDWTDDFSRFAAYEKNEEERLKLEQRIDRYLEAADSVTVVNRNLADMARERGADPVLVPNGADLPHMKQAWTVDLPRPDALIPLEGRPLVAYTGVFTSTRIDIDLVEKMLDLLDGWILVIVGDAEPAARERLTHRPDIRFIPKVSYDDLPAWYRYFDVCIVPHLDNAHTRGNDPLKVYEYLAAGKPVVSTPIAGIEPFLEHLTVAGSPEEFAAAVKTQKSASSIDSARDRARAVASHSWDSRAEALLASLSL